MPLEKGPIGTCQRDGTGRGSSSTRGPEAEWTSARVSAADGQQRVGGRGDGQSEGPDQGADHTGSRAGRRPPLTSLVYPGSGSLPHALGLSPERTSSCVLLGTEMPYRNTKKEAAHNSKGLES